MSNYISIDGGTTNTRIVLVKNSEIVAAKKFNIGAGCGDPSLLSETIRDGISAILTENNLTEGHIEKILASGMITSEFGLCTLPHLLVPAGLQELKAASVEVSLPEVSSIPFVFMRGLKTNCESLDSADMMRGEETELMGIITPEQGESIYMLMGSHSKIIKTDALGRITDFATLLSGELCSAAAKNTILKNSFSLDSSSLVTSYLLRGFEYCKKHGTGEALFKVRILKNLFSCTEDEAYSFFMGAILCSDAEYVLKTDPKKVVVCGNKALKNAISEILKSATSAEIITLSEEEVSASVVKGQLKIYEA